MRNEISWFAVLAVCTFLGRNLESKIALVSNDPKTALVKVLSASTDSKNHKTTLTVQTSNMKKEKWRSLFLHPGRDLKFPQLDQTLGARVVVVPNVGQKQNWQVKRYQAGATIGIHAGSGKSASPGFGDGKFEITIHWEKTTFELAATHGVTWYATKSGKLSGAFDSAALINHDGGLDPLALPQTRLALILNDDEEALLKIKLGSTTGVRVDNDPRLATLAYEVHLSTKLSKSYDHELSIGIESRVAPIPKEWAIEIRNQSGRLGEKGKTNPKVEVKIPNDDKLIGKKIHLVLVVKSAKGKVLYSSDPRTLQIVGN